MTAEGDNLSYDMKSYFIIPGGLNVILLHQLQDFPPMVPLIQLNLPDSGFFRGSLTAAAWPWYAKEAAFSAEYAFFNRSISWVLESHVANLGQAGINSGGLGLFIFSAPLLVYILIRYGSGLTFVMVTFVVASSRAETKILINSSFLPTVRKEKSL